MGRHLGIRSKVLAVLGLPMGVLALVSGVATFSAVQDARVTRAVGAFAAAQDGVLRVQTALQTERALSAQGPSPALVAARATTDREVAALDAALAASRLTSALPETAPLVSAVSSGHARLPELRRLVDAGAGSAGAGGEAVRSGYTALLATDVELPGAVADVLSDRDLGGRLAGVAVLGRAAEALSRASLAGAEAIGDGGASPQELRDLGGALSDRALALEAFRSAARLSAPAEVAELAAAGSQVDVLAARLSAEGSPPVSLEEWTAAGDRQAAALLAVARRVAVDAAAAADRGASAADQQVALVLAASVAVVGLMVLLALMQSRRITAPLRGLARAATATRDRLPAVVDAVVAREPDVELPRVVASTGDEIGAVAQAFHDVQSAVVDIARQQAALRVVLSETFVNVARRNQVLLGRQLDLIDSLERVEEDADVLGNLFHLDHLATRMRRNAESLLVLAGIDSGRQVRRPMPISDVVRTAISEIEHYERVQVVCDADPPVVTHAVLPLAHLVAELIENATQFSDPSTAVVVHVAAVRSTVQLVVRDRGLGMSVEELAEVNDRLGTPAADGIREAEALGSQRLGMHVVARLAARLGARVELASLGTGTQAQVDLPEGLFAALSLGSDDEAAPPTAVPEPEPAPAPEASWSAPVEPAIAEPLLVTRRLDPPVRHEPVPLVALGVAPPAPQPVGQEVAPPEQPSVAPPEQPPVALPELPPVALPELPPVARPVLPTNTVDVLPRQAPRTAFPLGRLGRRHRSRDLTDPGAEGTPAAPAVSAIPATPLDRPAWAGAASALERRLPSRDPLRRNESVHLPQDGASSLEDRWKEEADAGARSALASQALSELSLLAAYRPPVESPSAPSSLARRAAAPPSPATASQEVGAAGAAGSSAAVPGQRSSFARVDVRGPLDLTRPHESAGGGPDEPTGRAARTPDGVRSTLAAFAAGAARGRGEPT